MISSYRRQRDLLQRLRTGSFRCRHGLLVSINLLFIACSDESAIDSSCDAVDGNCDVSGPPLTYTTDFLGTENPLSEGGSWSNSGGDWTYVQKKDGLAFGTQTGTGGYDDSYAVLSGFQSDHSAWGRIHIDSQIDRSCNHEVEILLRWSDSPGRAQGYECLIRFDGRYAEIVRWNGPKGDFTYLARTSFPELRHGDEFKGQVSGNTITMYVNDVEVVSVTDDTYIDGNPGIGFFRRDCGTNADFAFSSYAATDSYE